MLISQRAKSALVASAILLTLVSSTAFAEQKAILTAPVAPATVEKANPDGSISLEGLVEFVELEGGYYRVGQWSLMGEFNFGDYLGHQVVLNGTPFDGISIRMVKSLMVTRISPKGEASPAPLEPVAVNSLFSVEGIVEYTDLEGGFYTVDGWGLVGDEDLFKAMQGKRVVIRGKEFAGNSIHQVRQIEVVSLMLPLAADISLPSAVTVNGRELPGGQRPVMIDGVLMLPLRHVVEAAGGKVEWDPREQAVYVSMPDRHAFFWVGRTEAEMNQNNVRYIRRNLLTMIKAPVIVKGRTMISADSLTTILGLYERGDTDRTLDILPLQ